MQGGLTTPHPLAQLGRATEVKKAAQYFNCDAVPTAAVATEDAAFASFGDGQIRIFRPGLPMQEVLAHRGAVLAMVRRGEDVLTGGDDGRLVLVSAEGTPSEVESFGRRWVDCIASARGGSWAASAGKAAHVRDANGRIQVLDHPSTVSGLAFDRKGERLAASHYGGVTIWTRGRRDWRPSRLHWAGSHVGVTWSPDNRFVVSTMQENALHGWRLRDKADMRMSGYPAKVKSVHWVGALPYLATSGAQQAICWPFDGANGPMGKGPMMLGHDNGALVTAVAGHPGQEAVLAGFESGTILISALDPIAEPRVIKHPGGAAITRLAVTAGSNWLLATAEDGWAFWAPLPARV